MTAEVPGERPRAPSGGDLAGLLAKVARGDDAAFAGVYDQFATTVYGIVRRVVRDPAQSEEVTQEVLLEVWRTASRFDPGEGSARGWLMTLAHRRAVDRVRSAQASAEREARATVAATDYDVVADEVETRLDAQRVRVDPAQPHDSAPRQSRNRISPSRIRVFTVPTATPSSAATSR